MLLEGTSTTVAPSKRFVSLVVNRHRTAVSSPQTDHLCFLESPVGPLSIRIEVKIWNHEFFKYISLLSPIVTACGDMGSGGVRFNSWRMKS